MTELEHKNLRETYEYALDFFPFKPKLEKLTEEVEILVCDLFIDLNELF